MRSDDILAQIDSTLEDWTVSGDAMRSRPGGESGGIQGVVPHVQIMDEVAAPRVWIAPVGTDPDADGWQEAGYISSADFSIDQSTIDTAALATPAPTVTWQELSDYIARAQAERARRAQLVMEAFAAFTEAIEAARPHAEEAGRAIADCAKAVQQAAPPQSPGRRRDRPAWQSPYGPAQRRR